MTRHACGLCRGGGVGVQEEIGFVHLRHGRSPTSSAVLAPFSDGSAAKGLPLALTFQKYSM